jgi:hypothetical protein
VSLKLTQTRLELLAAIDDGYVTQHYPLLPEPTYDQWDRGPGAKGRRRCVVTANVAQLAAEGYVRLGERRDSWYKSPRYWELTDAGRAVLVEARGGAS